MGGGGVYKLPLLTIRCLLTKKILTSNFVFILCLQEQAIKSEMLKQPNINEIGAALLPLINAIASGLTSFVHSSVDFQTADNFFPGQDWCNEWDPYSKWHLETSVALADLAFLFDEINRLIDTYGNI